MWRGYDAWEPSSPTVWGRAPETCHAGTSRAHTARFGGACPTRSQGHLPPALCSPTSVLSGACIRCLHSRGGARERCDGLSLRDLLYQPMRSGEERPVRSTGGALLHLSVEGSYGLVLRPQVLSRAVSLCQGGLHALDHTLERPRLGTCASAITGETWRGGWRPWPPGRSVPAPPDRPRPPGGAGGDAHGHGGPRHRPPHGRAPGGHQETRLDGAR